MIRKLIELHQSISLQVKAVVGIIIFTFLIIGIERYQISQNIINQFIEAKKSKNLLLINTIAPVIGVNISLGLEDANREYLDYISKQNSDVIFIELKGSEKQTIYENGNPKAKDGNNQEYMDFCDKEIIDPVSKSVIGNLHLHFSREDFDKLQSDNNRLTLKLLFMTFILLGLFLLLIQRELRPLKKLSESVCSYDPRLNNFALTPTIGTDEVGLIQNAIITMVEKIALHTHMLDEINHSLEDKIKERTKELEEANRQLKTLAITDMLTQLPNRRYFEEYYAKSWELAKRTGVNLSIVMCDIDHFKKVNRTSNWR